MQASVDGDNVTVTLSYANVEDLYLAIQHMQRDSRNMFTLSKQQDDGIHVVVAVCFEQNKRDWEGR